MYQSKKVTKILELINYQEGSVVSREIINNNAGTITVFAFDKDQGLSEHKAPYSAILQVIDGEAIVKISEDNYLLKMNELIIIPPNALHSVKPKTKMKMILTMLKTN